MMALCKPASKCSSVLQNKCYHRINICKQYLCTTSWLFHEDDTKSSKEATSKPSKKFKDSLVDPNMNRPKTPIGRLDEIKSGIHPHAEKEPLEPWPENTNPDTGEVGGPKGPEPTRYGDWERKGKVSDF